MHFVPPQKVLKLTYLSFLFEGVPKYWIYSKTSGKRLEGVQNYLLCVNLKQIIYKRSFLFFKRERNHHKDVLEKLVKCVIKYKHLLQALSKY